MPRWFIFSAGKDKDPVRLQRLTAMCIAEEVRKRKLGSTFIVLCDVKHQETARIVTEGLGIPSEEKESRCILSLPLFASSDRRTMAQLVADLDEVQDYPPADAVVILADAVHCAALANILRPGVTIRTDFLTVITGGGGMLLDRIGGRFVQIY